MVSLSHEYRSKKKERIKKLGKPPNMGLELTELHVHVGSAVDPAIMWSVAHQQGIKLPVKNYWDFVNLITVKTKKSFKEYLKLFKWTELIQSSPEAMERCTYEVIAGAYRRNNITTIELRYNPMKRNRGGERDLDHIILASVRGMERAQLEYPVKAGLILCLDKSFPYELNEIIVEKAMAYRKRGVVGIDFAGDASPSFKVRDYKKLVRMAKEEGLGITFHCGEHSNDTSVKEVLRFIAPDRLGHAIMATKDDGILDRISKMGITVELCPTSNLKLGVVKDLDEVSLIINKLKDHKVRFCINTDGPEMLCTTLLEEFEKLLSKNLISLEEIEEINELAREASFIREI